MVTTFQESRNIINYKNDVIIIIIKNTIAGAQNYYSHNNSITNMKAEKNLKTIKRSN